MVQLIEKVENNMKYEYNGNLIEEERVNLVATEIVNKYQEITMEEAKSVARLEGSISTKKDVDMEFRRLYNILFIIQGDKKRMLTVYTNLVNLLKNNPNNERMDYYYAVTLEIRSFLIGQREFPYLSEF